ncbi:hypothetical protein BBR47_48480 [Brevibacillus brevis NBRC 100599]|uniref:Uncharacterized protein n=1 Tax=Brevibacillus brevis (strain 47 / JCM 6285 / NBRC 100599) TaxID=358681 RepID=C0ZKZ8_BREBN|nr:hypothetical protein BBR47_48480 [Brevibacillus brevis NBRC 100599]
MTWYDLGNAFGGVPVFKKFQEYTYIAVMSIAFVIDWIAS